VVVSIDGIKRINKAAKALFSSLRGTVSPTTTWEKISASSLFGEKKKREYCYACGERADTFFLQKEKKGMGQPTETRGEGTTSADGEEKKNDSSTSRIQEK